MFSMFGMDEPFKCCKCNYMPLGRTRHDDEELDCIPFIIKMLG